MKGGVDRFSGKSPSGIDQNHAARGKAADDFDLIPAPGEERGPALEAGADVRAELWRKFSQDRPRHQPGIGTRNKP